MTTKVCTKCGVEKPLGEYYKEKRTKIGVTSQCKSCLNHRSSEYRKKNPKKAREISQRWALNNREKERAQSLKYRLSNPNKRRESTRRWRINNPEKLREFSKRSTNKMPPSYLKNILCNQYDISRADITPETIEMKRRSIKYYRELNQLKKLTE